jgi:hypothetical protein
MTDRFRKWVLFSVLSLAACTASHEEAPELPKSISPGWRITNFAREKEVWLGTYSGPGTAHVRIWPTGGQAEGLDRAQKWKAQPDTVVFFSDRYFAAVDWSGATRVEAGTLVRAIERAIHTSRDN